MYSNTSSPNLLLVYLLMQSFSTLFSSVVMLYLRQLKISVLCVLAKKVLGIKEAFSTVSFPTSCAKVVISPTTTALEENLSTETSLKMKTLPWSTLVLVSFFLLYSSYHAFTSCKQCTIFTDVFKKILATHIKAMPVYNFYILRCS